MTTTRRPRQPEWRFCLVAEIQGFRYRIEAAGRGYRAHRDDPDDRHLIGSSEHLSVLQERCLEDARRRDERERSGG